jgi:hypothetical protein
MMALARFIFQSYVLGDFLVYPESMTCTELIAFWVTFALTFVGFISWFNPDERLEKPSNTPSVIYHGRRNRKEMTRAELQKRIDELTRKYTENHDAKVKGKIDELSLNLSKLRRDKP